MNALAICIIALLSIATCNVISGPLKSPSSAIVTIENGVQLSRHRVIHALVGIGGARLLAIGVGL